MTTGPSDFIHPIVAVVLLASWPIAEGAALRVGRRARPGPSPISPHDRGSFGAILVGLTAVLTASFLLLAFQIGGFLPDWSVGVGLAVGGAGIGLRSWAIHSLGRFFSPVIRIEPEHRIVRAGPYQWLRHPSYTGLLLIAVGVSTSVGSIPGMIATVVVAPTPGTYPVHSPGWTSS